MLLLRLLVVMALLGLGYYLVNKFSAGKKTSGNDKDKRGDGTQAPSN